MTVKVNQTLRHLAKYWLPFVLWMGVIFYMSSRQVNPSSQFYWQDFVIKKTAHIIEYATFTFLLYRALVNSGYSKKKAAKLAVLAAIFYGMTDEFHQSFTPGREPRARDVVFDTIGSLVAIYTIWKLLPKAPVKLRNLVKKLQVI